MKNYFILILFFLSLPIHAQNKERAVSGNIESFIDRFDINNVSKNQNGWAHYYIPKGMADTLTVKMSCVFEGKQTHPPHIHNEDEAFYIVKGPVNFHINGEERILNTGDFVYTPSGSAHNIQRINEDTIKYLVLKRETNQALSIPYKVVKENYTFEECCLFLSKTLKSKNDVSDQILLLDKSFSDGFGVVLGNLSGKDETISNLKSGKNEQTAIYVISGKAKVEMNGNQSVLYADNTFYCPKRSSYILTKKGDEALAYLLITTK